MNIARRFTLSVALLCSSVALHADTFTFTYDYANGSAFTATIPLPVPPGEPDPNNDFTGSGALPSGVEPIPVSGTGIIDTDAGTISFGPINFETIILGGSTGFVGWAQTLNGSFVGNEFQMDASGAVVDGGALVCEDAGSSGCTGSDGEGAPPRPLLDDDFTFDMVDYGGTAQYQTTNPAFPNAVTTINITIDPAPATESVPVPAFALASTGGLLAAAGWLSLAWRRRRG